MKKILSILALFFFITSCEPTIEDYTEQWQETEGQVYNYADKYPSFKKEIIAQHEKAKPIWAKVDAAQDEDVKKAQMKLAITTAQAGALKKITNLEKRIASIERYENEFRDLPSDDFSSKTTLLINDANKLLPQAKTILGGTYTSVDSAYTLFDRITRRLMDQESQMEKHHNEIKRKRQEVKRAEELKKKERREGETANNKKTTE